MAETQFRLRGVGGGGLAPPMPAVAPVVAGTEARRRRGGVRLMLNRVSYENKRLMLNRVSYENNE